VINKLKQKGVQADDLTLIEQYLSTGNLNFLGILYDRYMHLVYGLCLKYFKDREDSKDAVMQIFEELAEKVRKHQIRNFKSWLHVLARNHCLMKLRAEKIQRGQLEKYAIDREDFMESGFAMHLESEGSVEQDVEALKKCIEQLKNEQRECVKLFYLEERCYKEVSEITGLELNKIKSYLQNGRRNLKICLERKDG
jgi:RNA polymerase sigma-70 factor (ECF subfamily)